MSRDTVLVRFRLKALEAAERLAEKIQRKSHEARKDAAAQEQLELRIVKAQEAGEKRAFSRGSGALRGQLGQAKGGVEKVASLVSGASLGNLAGGAALGAFAVGGVGGLVVQQLLGVIDKVKRELEDRADRLRASDRDEFLAEVDRRIYEADFNRRVLEDPVFARAQARVGLRQRLAEEKALAEGGWVAGGDSLEGF